MAEVLVRVQVGMLRNLLAAHGVNGAGILGFGEQPNGLALSKRLQPLAAVLELILLEPEIGFTLKINFWKGSGVLATRLQIPPPSNVRGKVEIPDNRSLLQTKNAAFGRRFQTTSGSSLPGVQPSPKNHRNRNRRTDCSHR